MDVAVSIFAVVVAFVCFIAIALAGRKKRNKKQDDGTQS